MFAPGEMKEPVLAAVGEIYFASRDAVFAVEVSVRRCSGAYVIVGVWQSAALDIAPEQLRSFSRQRYRAFRLEPIQADESAKIRNARHIFVKL